MSTPMAGLPHAMPSTRLAHFGPTPWNERIVSSSQPSSPSSSRTTRVAMAWICAALASWNVHVPISSSISATGSAATRDGVLATAVLVGISLDAAAGWWWADPLAGYVLVFYAAREAREIYRDTRQS